MTYIDGKTAVEATRYLFTDQNMRFKEKGVIAPEVLNTSERKYFFDEARKFDITVDQIIE